MKNNYFETEIRDGICIIWLDQIDSKVNKIGPEMIRLFEPLVSNVLNDPEINAAVLISRKKDFIAGADIEAFDSVKAAGDWAPIAKSGHHLLFRIERSAKPFVAAVHGACMGAGTEIALACTARVAADEGTIFALPEVKLGLLPGGGGTQRLPKLIGLQSALDMMLTGKNIYPYPAKKIGLVDRLASQPALLDAAIALANELIVKPLRRSDHRPLLSKLLESNRLSRNIIYKKARQVVDRQTKGNYPAPYEILECVRSGIEQGPDAGYREEVTRFEKLILSPESRQLRNVFFAMTEKKKNRAKNIAKPIDRIAVLGAGFMGAGIAEVTVAKPIQVVLKDLKSETIAAAKKTIWSSLQSKLKRKAISSWDADRQINRVIGQLDYAHFDSVPLVIEAVFEELAVKHRVLTECESQLADDAIFASNTSALPISDIAQVAKRPAQVIGMHYFSPVPKMPLLEIIKTEQTADWVVATCYELGLQQGKTVIVVNDGPGFYTTRILAPMMAEALNLLDEGADILQVDKALTKFGFPVGPITLMDEVGIDVGAHIMSGRLIEHFKSTRDGVKLSDGLQKMFQSGYHGRKNKQGFYQYDAEGKKIRGKVNETAYSFFSSSSRRPFSDTEIVERIVWSFVGEAVRCLQESIIESPLDGDVGAVFGLGFPPFLGGPFRYIDSLTAKRSCETMQHLSTQHGPRFTPPNLLVEISEQTSRRFYN